MSKVETLRQSAAASNAARVAELAGRIEDLRQAKHQSVEELAAALEPIAQAMATLTDETRQTLAGIAASAQAQGEAFKQQVTTSTQSVEDATRQAKQAIGGLERAGRWLRWTHYALTVATGLFTAVLVSGFWLWRAPPTVPPLQLDAKAVAAYLKPAVIEALKPSRGK
jgi:methyl-accepting chemotaxis protein